MMQVSSFLLAQMYVEERVAQAAQEHLLREAERARRATRAHVALKARVGRALVRVGQRLDASTHYPDVELSVR